MSDTVRIAVERALAGLVPGAAIVGWDGPHEREWSWHWTIRTSGPSGGRLLLKIPRWEEAPTLEAALAAGEQDSTHREIDGLRRIEVAVLSAGDPGLTAIEPVGYVAAVNGILMRWLEGESLRERLGRGRGSGDVAALFHRVGRWIDVFHRIDGDPVVRPFAASEAIERSRDLERRVRSVRRPGRGLLSAMAMLRLAAEERDGTPEPWAEIHGDLNLSNVIVATDDRVAVVDPNREVGPALLDPVRLATDARLERGQLVTGGVLRRADVMGEWEHRLLDGCGMQAEPMLGYRLAEAAIERWAELEVGLRGASRIGLVPGRNLLRRVVRSRLDALA